MVHIYICTCCTIHIAALSFAYIYVCEAAQNGVLPCEVLGGAPTRGNQSSPGLWLGMDCPLGWDDPGMSLDLNKGHCGTPHKRWVNQVVI